MIMGMKSYCLYLQICRLFPCGRACKYRGMVLHLDPVGARLGSGGRNDLVVGASRRKEAPDVSTEEWLGQEKRILLHAGGKAAVCPDSAPSGKILTPIPVFRWARGQRLSQNLLSLQLPLYERIMKRRRNRFIP